MERKPLKRSVKIVDYDPRWPVIYAREKDRILRATSGRVVAIEHVGSTAVHGLAAKPIVDIMAGVRRLSDAEECIGPLGSIGYEYVPEYEKELPYRRYFRKGPEGVRNRHFHLHMVEQGGDFWKKHLLFRGYLRRHRDVAQQYCRLKRELARKHASDREAYTEAKSAFIESVLAEALASPMLRLRYIRLPSQTMEMYDDSVYRSRRVVIGRSQVTSVHSVVFDGKTVMSADFPIVYFELTGRWFSVIKVRDLNGRHTGYYCDICTPPKVLEDGSVEITDLFLDVWVSPDLRYQVLDEDELEEALRQNQISEQLYVKAKNELKKLLALIEKGKFPPQLVRHLEERLQL